MNMTNTTKTFLVISAIGFVAGGIVDFCGVAVNPVWTVALPTGAIFLGLFMISLVLEKEVAAFDAEEARKRAQIRAREQHLFDPGTKP
jgi:hypothetical protein